MNLGTEDLSVSAQAAQAVSQILMSPHMANDAFYRQQSIAYLDKPTNFPVQTSLDLSTKPKPLDLPKLVTAHFASDPHLLSPESLNLSLDSWQESLASINMVAHEQADLLNTSFLHAPGQPTGESLSEPCLEISPTLSPANLWSDGAMPCFAHQTALWVEQSSGQINSHVQLYPESPLAGNADTSQHASHPKSPLLPPKKPSAAKASAKSPRKRQTLSVPQKRVLYTYMVAHMDNPYPNDDERLNELNIDGLSKQRFKWWFSNHRHRSLELRAGG
ncbi:hypothetical protein H4R22_002283 [Coemansia sp. RSA 1290]|nr:hypothetical protein LPJ68_005663 [Coemansia sp. RSA 1086]KAJ2631000.1 hypothetical protein H4R22_002283 [Coemansia sp. RSA 1290]